jgi:hypothetical protein
VYLLWRLRPWLNWHEVERLSWWCVLATICVVELADLHSVPKPLIPKRLKLIEGKPFVEQIDRHAFGQVVDVPYT